MTLIANLLFVLCLVVVLAGCFAIGADAVRRELMPELELHRADYKACKAAGWDSPGELLSAHNTLLLAHNTLSRPGHKQVPLEPTFPMWFAGQDEARYTLEDGTVMLLDGATVCEIYRTMISAA